VSTAVLADGGNDHDGNVTGSRWCRGSGVEVVNTTVSAYVGNDVGDCTSEVLVLRLRWWTRRPMTYCCRLLDGRELSATRSHSNNPAASLYLTASCPISIEMYVYGVHRQFRYTAATVSRR